MIMEDIIFLICVFAVPVVLFGYGFVSGIVKKPEEPPVAVVSIRMNATILSVTGRGFTDTSRSVDFLVEVEPEGAPPYRAHIADVSLENLDLMSFYTVGSVIEVRVSTEDPHSVYLVGPKKRAEMDVVGGVEAEAMIVSMRKATGSSSAGGKTDVRFCFRVEQAGLEPYEVKRDIAVDIVDLVLYYRPGARVRVRCDPSNPKTVVLVGPLEGASPQGLDVKAP
ncbi:hypothetical protein G6O69_20015 [Pseudenhygromyxa sp. WMMC2535]|uniref:hypothetical protein n=1 Tax=Pseudenhygromyxa sp. WMMC2535 TaxID=2712867 RepID=UPI001555CD25|nr:hypothetical protein [Pseudenhygromyxa sp. WMMC2535]NVB40143.1 hypothetical protein [Pseudenhygromyxa sp. WMMC2535]